MKIKIEEILSRNPQVSEDDLNDAREMLNQLREMGVHRKEYDLALPFGGRRVTVRDNPHVEPRLNRLKHEHYRD